MNAGAALRIAAPFFGVEAGLMLIAAAIFLWSGAFLAFTIVYERYLVRGRI